jgi:hypothetical protein
MLPSRKECLAHFDRFPSARDLNVGQAVAIRTHCRPDRDLAELLTLARTDNAVDTSLRREFVGRFDPIRRDCDDEEEQDRFAVPGFIRDQSGRGDIYVPRELVELHRLRCHDTVRGVAVFQRVRRPRPKDGWRAIQVTSSSPVSETPQ